MKLVGTLAFILAVSLLPFGAFAAVAVAWLFVMVLAVVSRLGPVRILRSSFVALPFVAAAVPLIFTRDGNILGHIDLGLFTLRISGEGLRDVATIVLKSWVSVQAALLLIFSTRFNDIVHGMGQMKCPWLLVSVVSLMYRYLSVIQGESSRMLRARDARTIEVEGARGPSFRWRATVVGHMVGSLFLRALERSERVYVAMQSRGYDGRGTVMRMDSRGLTGGEWALTVGCVAAFALLSVAGRFWLPVE